MWGREVGCRGGEVGCREGRWDVGRRDVKAGRWDVGEGGGM